MFQARRDPKSPLDGTSNDTEVSGRGVSSARERKDIARKKGPEVTSLCDGNDTDVSENNIEISGRGGSLTQERSDIASMTRNEITSCWDVERHRCVCHQIKFLGEVVARPRNVATES